MRQDVSERVLVVLGLAGGLALTDLVVKAAIATPPWNFHTRSEGWVVLSVVLLVLVPLLAFVPSRAVALAAGVMCGGVLGNLVSARVDGDRVPNPFLLGDYRNGVAFNLADVYFLLGNLLLMATLIVVTLRNRDRLIPPRAWERSLRRHLGR
jgi:hypothetical protein